MKTIKLKNWAFINVYSFLKNKSFNKDDIIKYLNSKILKNNDLKLKYNLIDEIDYISIEIWIVCKLDNFIITNKELISIFDTLNIDLISQINLDLFCHKKYIICNNFLDLNFVDNLLYNVYYKKNDELKYIYSDVENNEFVWNFLKHIIRFDIYYSKILAFYKKFSLNYPDLQKSNISLIKDYEKLINNKEKNINNNKLQEIQQKLQNLQAINFWLMYDIESLKANKENLESRLKTIWWEWCRYFLNHIEKANFIIDSFESVLNKNNLVKDNILNNYLEFVKNDIETQKLENDKKKINHIKNIKEILGWLAFVEIFINWLSEASKIFNFWDNVWLILQNTSFMRMVLILIFIIWYFIFILFLNSKPIYLFK